MCYLSEIWFLFPAGLLDLPIHSVWLKYVLYIIISYLGGGAIGNGDDYDVAYYHTLQIQGYAYRYYSA